ncbi:hypothetical protein [Embleya sp. NPDC001921]
MTILAVFLVITVVVGALSAVGRSADTRDPDNYGAWHKHGSWHH